MTETATAAVPVKKVNPLVEVGYSKLGRAWYGLKMWSGLAFNLPLFYNLRQGLKIAKTGSGHFIGSDSKVNALAPMIGVGVLTILLALVGLNGPAMTATWGALLFIFLWMGFFDVKRNAIVGVLVGLVGVVAAAITLTTTGVWDVLGAIGDVFRFFHMGNVDIGLVGFCTAGFAAMVIKAMIVSRVASAIHIEGNLMLPDKLSSTTQYPSGTHRLRTDVDDWAERAVLSTVDMHIMSITAAEQKGNVDDEAVHTLRNVPGGMDLEHIIRKKWAAQDVDIKG